MSRLPPVRRSRSYPRAPSVAELGQNPVDQRQRSRFRAESRVRRELPSSINSQSSACARGRGRRVAGAPGLSGVFRLTLDRLDRRVLWSRSMFRRDRASGSRVRHPLGLFPQPARIPTLALCRPCPAWIWTESPRSDAARVFCCQAFGKARAPPTSPACKPPDRVRLSSHGRRSASGQAGTTTVIIARR